ncbi:hypothetical protein OC25_03810 [Pedobacter kyungheensis]|uniref:Plasmid maintenance system antidote protein VapI, contains XRE-type HTH domain n=2 Tax=Pedobacter TaxID=84567 RepID=A0A1G6K4J7_9SPHI|nr:MULTISPECIES: helix-turn-helix transcriptional regulator [Pedobacter]KIA96215.1 hypothetical protein OC25_03810 [Pedobacter kyungheensis]SDC25246.1 Plasmid maintenance system antidote protein VapI, contains XRE-type HTH domain [Pedobacter soli]
MQKLENNIGKNVGRNLSSLLEQSGITILGFSNATGISLNHARVIKNGRASITLKTAEKIASFFSVEPDLLFLENPIILGDLASIPTISEFYLHNDGNEKFFINKVKESSITLILKSQLIPSSLFNNWVRSMDILVYFNENKHYLQSRNLFNAKSISKALSRIYQETELLERDDLRKNGKVFRYRRKL